jgi:hypothetical protein
VVVLIEEPFFTLRIRPSLSPEQWNEVASALCKIAIDPPRPLAERRVVCVRTALAQYRGSQSARCKVLERRYRGYLASGWPRERDLEELPEPRSTERVLLHRLAKLGAPSSWRQLFDIAAHRDTC